MVPDAINLLASSNLRRMRKKKDSSVCPDDSTLESLTPFSSCSAFLLPERKKSTSPVADLGSAVISRNARSRKTLKMLFFLHLLLEEDRMQRDSHQWRQWIVWILNTGTKYGTLSTQRVILLFQRNRAFFTRNLFCPRSLLFLPFYDYNILQFSFLHLTRATPFQIYCPHSLFFIF